MAFGKKAQVSVEYLLVVAAVILIAVIIVVLSLNLSSLKNSVKNQASLFKNKTLEMI